MAIELSEDEKTKIAQQIRSGDSNAARLQAELEQQKLAAQQADMKKIDEIRLKIDSGGTLSPEEDAFLKARERGEPTPADANKPGADAGGSGDAETDAIIAKMEKGEDLTDDERKKALEYISLPTFEDKIYKIGGKEIKTTDLFNQWLKEEGLDAKDFKDSAIPKIVENYATKLNKAEWARAQQRRDQDLAKSRRQVGEVTLRLLQAQEDIKNKLVELSDTIKEVKELASKDVDPNSIYDENNRVDPMKQRELNKVLDARENLERLTKKFESLRETSVQTENKLVAQRFRDFQESYPQYRTSQDVTALGQELGKGTLSAEDELKIGEMIEIFQQADAKRWTPDQQYDYRLKLSHLAVKPLDSSSSEVLDASKFKKDSDRDQLLKALKEKRGAALSLKPTSIPSARNIKPDEQKVHAENIRASSQMAFAGGTSINEKLAKDGY